MKKTLEGFLEGKDYTRPKVHCICMYRYISKTSGIKFEKASMATVVSFHYVAYMTDIFSSPSKPGYQRKEIKKYWRVVIANQTC